MIHDRQKKIVLVEDSRLIRELLRAALICEGYDVIAFESAVTATSAIKTEAPDLVLLDLALPDGSGIDVLQNLRANPITAKIPVVILTASYNKEDLIAANRNGASAIFLKDSLAYKRLIETVIPIQ